MLDHEQQLEIINDHYQFILDRLLVQHDAIQHKYWKVASDIRNKILIEEAIRYDHGIITKRIEDTNHPNERNKMREDWEDKWSDIKENTTREERLVGPAVVQRCLSIMKIFVPDMQSTNLYYNRNDSKRYTRVEQVLQELKLQNRLFL
jgi:hypothetical protein